MAHFGAAWFCGSSGGLCYNEPAPSTSYTPVDLRELVRRNQLIEQQIESDRLTAKKTLKILLLGGFFGSSYGHRNFERPKLGFFH